MIHIYVPLLANALNRNQIRHAMRNTGVLKNCVSINKHSSFVSIGPNSLNHRSRNKLVAVLCRSSWYACSKGRIAPGAVSHTTIVLMHGCQMVAGFETDLGESVERNRPDRVLMLTGSWEDDDDKQSLKRFIETEHGLHVELKEIG